MWRERFLTRSTWIQLHLRPMLFIFKVSIFVHLCSVFKNKSIKLNLITDLHCCMQTFSSCGEQGLLFVAVRGLLIEVASLIVEHGL